MTGDWRKSSYSFSNGGCVEWRTSSYCRESNCVEVAHGVQVRDSKDPGGPVLAFSESAWGAWVAAVKAAPCPSCPPAMPS